MVFPGCLVRCVPETEDYRVTSRLVNFGMGSRMLRLFYARFTCLRPKLHSIAWPNILQLPYGVAAHQIIIMIITFVWPWRYRSPG